MNHINEVSIKKALRYLKRLRTGKTPESALDKAKERLDVAGKQEVKNAIVHMNDPQAKEWISGLIDAPRHQKRVRTIQRLTGLQELVQKIQKHK